MSYSFTLNFRHCRSLGEALLLANKTADAVYANLSELLKENHYYIPSIRFEYKDLSDQEKRIKNDAWLEKLMKLNFVWWPQYKLLAFSGDGWPKAAMDLYKQKVFFQNSCDQDYEFSEWKGLGTPFKEVVEIGKNGSHNAVLQLLNEGREKYPVEITQEEMDDSVDWDYYRRWAVYNAIYERLHLDLWLYGKDDPAFVRFTLSALNSQERELDASILLNGYAHKHKNDYV